MKTARPMATILGFLGNDHRTCDALFASAGEAVAHKRWDAARGAFERFLAAMRRHLAREETVLFPAFEARTANSMGPTRVMRMQHEQMRRLLDDMGRTVADRDASRYLALAETLFAVMRRHNEREEALLFPMFDRMLDEEREGLIRAMLATGE